LFYGVWVNHFTTYIVVGVILITMMVMFNHKVHNDTGFGFKIMHSDSSRSLG
jgi:hypothetical protein